MLEKYRDKRNFDVTAEPSPEDVVDIGNRLRFVVQKHSARNLHYDLRLEVEGVLKSWAVPKGPSLKVADRRLAVHVEDHPLSYASFEGVIPKGEYGGGEIIVWDEGTYAVEMSDSRFEWDRAKAEPMMVKELAKGKCKIYLEGQKLRGPWNLVRGRDDKTWLLIKAHGDGEADRDVLDDDKSVVSGRTNEDLRMGRPAQRTAMPKGAVQKPMPKTLTPMAATEVTKALTNDEWSFELKLDGIRALAFLEGGKARVITRNAKDITNKFPALVRELEAIAPSNCILDGEIVAFNDAGKPSFQVLMQRFSVTNQHEIKGLDQHTHVDLVLFDVLYLQDSDLRSCIFQDRRKLLEELNIKGRHVHLNDAYGGEGELLYEQALNLGLEGVVGKRLDSIYLEGHRTKNWIKVKGSHTEEFLVCGYTPGQGARVNQFGSLILGQEKDGKLEYCGNVGTGFSDDLLDAMKIRMDKLKVDEPTLTEKVESRGKPIWIKPEIIVEVRFMTWTPDHRLRAPSFLRIREDLMGLAPKVTVKEEEPKQEDTPDLLDQIAKAKDELRTKVDGHDLKFSSLNKVLWPATETTRAVTKRDLLTYYVKVAVPLLRSLRDRPLSLVRYPNGIEGEGFFQKHVEKGVPDFVERVDIWSSHNDRSTEYLLANNLASLLWMGQNSVLEIHPWYSRCVREPDARDLPADFSTNEDALDESVLNFPDFLVVDLDPNLRSGKEKDGAEPEMNRAGWDMAVKVAKRCHEILLEIGLKSFLKTSGKTGLHLYVPIVREYNYDMVRAYAETLGRHVEKQMPKEVTMEWSVKKRPEKVFFDHNQNVRGKTLVAAYSPRPAAGATVSMPIRWDELDHIYPGDFDIFNTPDRLASMPDPWADILQLRQRLL